MLASQNCIGGAIRRVLAKQSDDLDIIPIEIVIKVSWIPSVRKVLLEEPHEVFVVGDADIMEIDLREHEIARGEQSFRCEQTTVLEGKRYLSGFRLREHEGLDEAREVV